VTAPYDIFRLESNDSVLWLDKAKSLEDAKSRVQELSAGSPGPYIVLNQLTGDKLVIKSDNANGTHTVDQG
jgi:hypothetical protein